MIVLRSYFTVHREQCDPLSGEVAAQVGTDVAIIAENTSLMEFTYDNWMIIR